MGTWLHKHIVTTTDVSKDSGEFLAEILAVVSVHTMVLWYMFEAVEPFKLHSICLSYM
jgi:hypothetical protein